MKTRLGLGCEFNIARDDRGLSLRLHASQTKSEGSWTFVHSTALAHARVFSMLNHWNPELAGGLQCLSHDTISQNGTAIIGHGHCASFHQCFEVRQSFTIAADGGGSDGMNFGRCSALGLLHPTRNLGRVIHGRSVRHGADCSETTNRCGGCPGRDCLFMALPRLA